MTAVENSPNIRTIFGGHHPKKIIFDVFSAENNFFIFNGFFAGQKLKFLIFGCQKKTLPKII
jgi:hypothetical protein